MHVRPRAKVNLTLSVGPRGADGYHPISSLFLRIGLADDLTVALADDTGDDLLTVSGLPGCEVEGNLVLRAFRVTRAAIGVDLPPLVAHLDKRIPIAAGLGGGSADAAGAIDAALQMWGAALSPQILNEVAAEIGSDVPFFAHNVAVARVSGRGELVEPLDVDVDAGLLLVTPPVALSTARIFDRFDALSPNGVGDDTSLDALDLTDLLSTASTLRDANDLWSAAVAVAPELGPLRAELEDATHQPWLMSGSGPTLFAIYPSVAEAAAAGEDLAGSRSDLVANAQINAVDTVGPDPAWRYPWA